MEKVLLEHCVSGSLVNLESFLKRGISPNVAFGSSGLTVFVAICKIFNCLVVGKDFSVLGELKNYIDKWINDYAKKLQLMFHLEKVIKLLLHYGASAEYCDINGNNALQLCAETKRIDILKIFFEKGINPNLVDVNRNSVLHLSLNKYDDDPFALTEYLANQGVDVNIVNKAGLSALHLAAQYRHSQSVVVLLQKGAQCNVTSNAGDTPLILACIKKPAVTARGQASNQMCSIVKTLLLHGTSINVKNKSGRTALHHAALSFHNRLIRILLKEGANVNCTDGKSQTPLHLYLQSGNLSINGFKLNFQLTTVFAMLEAGALITALDSSGQCPMCCLLQLPFFDLNIFFQIIKLFLEAGLTLNALPKMMQRRLQVFVLEKSDWCLIEKTIVVYGWKYDRQVLLECDTALKRGGNPRLWSLESILTLQRTVRDLVFLSADRTRHLLHKNAVFGVTKLEAPDLLKNIICPT